MKDFLLSYRPKSIYTANYYITTMYDPPWSTMLVRASNEREAAEKLKTWYKKMLPTMWVELEIINSTIE